MSRPSLLRRQHAVAFLAFVSLGLPDGLLGVAWPSMRASLDVPLQDLGGLLAAATVGFVASSFASGSLVQRLGLGRVLCASTVLVIVSLSCYALTPAWWLALFAGLLAGLGAGAIDSGVNHFAASHLSPRTVSLLHASYGVGAAIGPLIMTAAVTHSAGQSLGWRAGYATVAIMLVPLLLLFARTLRMWDSPATATAGALAPPEPAPFKRALRSPRVLVGVALFFLYVGLEVTAAQWTFTLLTTSRSLSPAQAGACVSLYWWALTLGRVLFGLLAPHLPARHLVRAGCIIAPIGAALLLRAETLPLAAAALALLGLGFAPIYPLLMSLTPGRTGTTLAPHAIGMQVAMSYVGAAAIPGAIGVLAARTSIESVAPALLAGTLLLLALHEAACRFAPSETRANTTAPV